MLVPPLAHLDVIDRMTLNRALVAWGHRMGPWERPSYREIFHGLFVHGELVAVTAAGDLIRETAAGLTRAEAFELGRLCAADAALTRVMLRLWRQVVYPPLCRAHGWRWAISYQDAALHSGATYRLDGWVRLGRSRSGTDARSGRRGRDKVIWGWTADAAVLAERAHVSPNTVTRIEADNRANTSTLAVLRQAFEAAGVCFTERGVQLRG